MQSIFFDLHRELTTNPTFNQETSVLLAEITKAQFANDSAKLGFYVKQLLKKCEYNPSLLVPYFFPTFVENQPMTLWSRPHAFAMFGFTLTGSGSLTVQASRQVGKCVTGETKLTVKDKDGDTSCATIKDIFLREKGRNSQ